MTFLVITKNVAQFFVGMAFLARRGWRHDEDSVEQFVAPTFPEPGVVEFGWGEQQSSRSRTEPETADCRDGGRHGVYFLIQG